MSRSEDSEPALETSSEAAMVEKVGLIVGSLCEKCKIVKQSVSVILHSEEEVKRVTNWCVYRYVIAWQRRFPPIVMVQYTRS